MNRHIVGRWTGITADSSSQTLVTNATVVNVTFAKFPAHPSSPSAIESKAGRLKPTPAASVHRRTGPAERGRD
jgi:hypothetical protein